MNTAWSDAAASAAARLSFRAATLDDLDGVMRIERACFDAPWPRSVMADEIRGLGCSRLEVAVDAGGVAGFMIFQVIPPEAHLINLAVTPGDQRRGVGRALLERLLDVVRDEGVTTVFLEVRASNLVAQRLYAEAGFERIDVRRGYYADNGEDALVLSLRWD